MRELGTQTIGPRWRGCQLGVLHALLPLPVDSDACLAEAGLADFADTDDRWDHAFDRVVGELVRALAAGATDPLVVTAPPRPPAHPWRTRLARFFTFRPTLDPLALNPLGLTPAQALLAAARDDSHLCYAAVGSAAGEVQTRDGHPVLWVWLAVDAAPRWRALVATAAGDLGTTPLALAWDALVPRSYSDARVITDVRANQVLWTDGAGVLELQAAFVLSHPGNAGAPGPREVYVPGADAWPGCAPDWARDARTTVVADLVAGGWRVVERPGARVGDRDPGRR